MNPQTNPMLNLDVLSNIIQFLPLNDAWRLRVVCSDWQYCIENHFKTIKIITLTGNVICRVSWMYLAQLKSSMDLDMKSVFHNRIYLPDGFFKTRYFARILIKLFPNITEIYFIGGSYWKKNYEAFKFLCKKLFRSLGHQIRKLGIDHHSYALQIVPVFKNLKSLNTFANLTQVSPSGRARNFVQKIQKLSLSSHTLIPMRVLTSSVSLESLSFHYSTRLSPFALQPLTRDNFPNLKNVGLPLMWAMEPIIIFEKLLFLQPNLTSIELCTNKLHPDFTDKTAESLVNLLIQFPVLHSLTIYVSIWCPTLMKEVAKRISTFPVLETFCLHIPRLSDTNLFVDFLQNLPELPALTLNSTGSTPKIVIEILEKSSILVISKYLRQSCYAYQIEVRDLGFFLDENCGTSSGGPNWN